MNTRRLRAQGWIDVHAHFSPPKSADDLQTNLQLMHMGCFMAREPFQWSKEATLEHMDGNGIAMQLLSNIPKILPMLRESNDFGASVVGEHPSRFGLLAALPTDDPDAAMGEIRRADQTLQADGFAVTCCYNGVFLGDTRLAPVWAELDRRAAAVFMHPDAYAFPSQGRPSALLEVAFETARTVVDMLYAGVFRNYPNIKFVVAHCGGPLPALSGRLALLGAEHWVPNSHGITKAEIRSQLAGLFLDTAATGTAHTLRPALAMTTCDHLVYGSDCGVPCTTDATMVENLQALLQFSDLSEGEIQWIGRNALRIFPSIGKRLGDTADQAAGVAAERKAG